MADALENSTQVLVPTTAMRAEISRVPQAETTTVKGTVRSSKTKEPLPFANIILVGTNRGTTTNMNGAFELKEVPLNSLLAISYVGYEARTVEVGKENQAVNVVLQREQRPLESVMVIGYGLVKATQPVADSMNAAPKTDKEMFTVVEQMPEFPGGIQEMYKLSLIHI